MANGQQLAKQNYQAFMAWAASKNDDDFREYVYRGKLKRAEIAAECCFGKSALTQNPQIRKALEKLEDDLRARSVLPLLKQSHDREIPPMRDRDAVQRMRDKQRLNILEQTNALLNAKVKALEAKLKELNALDDYLKETGRLPR